MQSDIGPKTLRTYEKLAGWMFQTVILMFISGAVAYGMISGGGEFAEKAKNIADGQMAYRITITTQIAGYIMTILLAFSLYAILRRFNELVARLALYFRLVEVAVACVVLSYRYVQLDLYANPEYAAQFTPDQVRLLLNHTTEMYVGAFNIAGILFSFGSTLFFYLLTRTRYVPRWIGYLGVLGSVAAGVTCVAVLIFPQYGILEMGWLPSLFAEIFAGAYLIIVGSKHARPYLTEDKPA